MKKPYLLDARDVIYSQFFQGELEFFVIGCGRSVDHLLLSAGGTLSKQNTIHVSVRNYSYLNINTLIKFQWGFYITSSYLSTNADLCLQLG